MNERSMTKKSSLTSFGATKTSFGGVLPLSNIPMSKQDTVAPGLRVHLHQQGFAWALRGVLISTGLKQGLRDPIPVTVAEAGLEGVLSARSGRLGRCGYL